MAKLIINEENKKSRIEPEIYGHFSEHLGRCIYEGIYVGEKSEIPNVNGMRTDVVDGTDGEWKSVRRKLRRHLEYGAGHLLYDDHIRGKRI